MYQIFVVEDELLIRQSVRNAIEHMQGPYVCCGEASAGELALSMMQDLMPDILLTDIRMPFLDGFGLIKHARAMMPWLKIVIISGYGDFEFTQKAIGLGVDRYLLKPVRQAELKKTIEEVAALIERDRAHPSLPEGFDSDEVNDALRQRFVRQLIFGGSDTAVLLEQAQKLKLDIVRAYYQVAVCYFDKKDPDISGLRLRVKLALGEESQTLYEYDAADRLTLISFDNDEEALSERAYRIINILRHELSQICPVLTAVISDSVRRLGAIPDAYRSASDILKHISGLYPGQVIHAGDTAQITARIVSFTGPFGEGFKKKLILSGVQDVPALIDETLDGPEGGQFDSVLMRYYALVELMRISVAIIAGYRADSDENETAELLSKTYDINAASGDKRAFRETAIRMLEGALSVRVDSPQELKYSQVISRAEAYVKDNFCDPNISLISVARHVGMSAAHFSTVFSQTTGRSFITYLTALRVEKAKSLLREGNMRLADIAMEIGYNEPNYFSHVFKKSEGITPKEYRSQNQ